MSLAEAKAEIEEFFAGFVFDRESIAPARVREVLELLNNYVGQPPKALSAEKTVRVLGFDNEVRDLKIANREWFPIFISRPFWPFGIELQETQEGLLILFGERSSQRYHEVTKYGEIGQALGGPVNLNVMLVDAASGMPPHFTQSEKEPLDGLLLRLNVHAASYSNSHE